MFKKLLRNWLVTALGDVVRAEVTRQRGEEARQVRELTAEVEDVMERLQRQLSRSAMRQLRETRAAAAAQEEEVSAPNQGEELVASLTPKQLARLRWRQQAGAPAK